MESEESHRKPPHRGFNLWLKARHGYMRINLLSAKSKKISKLSPPQTSTTFPFSLISQIKIGWQRDCGVSSWSRAEPVAIETNEPLSSTCLPSLPVDLFFPLFMEGQCGVAGEVPHQLRHSSLPLWPPGMPPFPQDLPPKWGRGEGRWTSGGRRVWASRLVHMLGFSPSPWHLVFLLC